MNLKIFVYKTGKPLSEIKQVCDLALKEAQILGLEHDEMFVESVIREILDMDETEFSQCIRDLNKKFVESKYDSFNDFMESLIVEDGISGGGTTVSTSFSLSSRPESLVGVDDLTFKKKKKKDEEDKKD